MFQYFHFPEEKHNFLITAEAAECYHLKLCKQLIGMPEQAVFVGGPRKDLAHAHTHSPPQTLQLDLTFGKYSSLHQLAN